MKKFLAGIFTFLFCICVISPIIEAEADEIEPETAAHGSGSYQLNSVPTDYRFYTEYFVMADSAKKISTAGIDRRTSIKVYANAGERILFGSSVSNSKINIFNEFDKDNPTVSGVDIVITTPDGTKVPFDVLAPGEYDESISNTRPNGLGYIKDPVQEKNGPMVNHSNESDGEHYYVPLQYPVTVSGVYTFEFHSVTGFNPNSGSGYHPSPKKAGEAWSQGNTAVAAWDVTVLGKTADLSKWEVKSGRAWADYLALTTAGAKVGTDVVKSDLNVHVLSHDGYQYKVDFNEAAPYGFIFFANNTGFMSAVTDNDTNTTTYRPVYHSFYDSSNDLDGIASENIFLHKPDEADTETEETYKIFFNAPNPDLNGISYTRYGKTDTIKTKPDDTVIISDLTFTGVPNDLTTKNITRTGHGGYFTFHSTGEAMVTIRLDLRKAIYESEGTMDTYSGSGIVEITAPAIKTTDDLGVHVKENSVYWDGKDTDGVTIPAGIYGNSNVVISTEVKRGELHFPVIDMEGLYGGLTVKRLNGENSATENAHLYDLYYNNNPLAYGTIEGTRDTRVNSGSYYVLSDGTKSFIVYSDKVLGGYFTGTQNTISTLKKDDKEYLSQKLFAKSYTDLDTSKKSIIDAEFESEKATYHYEAVDSRSNKMYFKADGNEGGGNKSGIDTWTYYSSGVNSDVISFAVMDTNNRGMIKGQIFYDAHNASGYPNSEYNVSDGDYMLSGIKVRLIDATGKPLVHTESLPSFDETGHFKYDTSGNIVFDDVDVKYEAVTDSTGTYRFTSVPYSTEGGAKTKYYVQVMLTDVQSEVMRYTCTTSGHIKETLKTSDDASAVYFIQSAISSTYGADGNTIVEAKDSGGNWDPSKIYRYKYDRNSDNETIFVKDHKDDTKYAQSVEFSFDDTVSPEIPVVVHEFKMIGFSSTVPNANQKDIKVVKKWGTDSNGNPTHKISDGLTVELWVWNDTHVDEVNAEEHKITRRTGALVDTQVLDEANGWTYTWNKLDDRLQYYVLEYYTKKKSNGEIIYNDKGEPRKVLIGGTLPIFSVVPDEEPYNKGIYGFNVSLGDYSDSELMTDPYDSTKKRIKIQKFSENDTIIHSNALTDKEKLESVDNNARQYDVSYTLKNDGSTNIITITNSQVYDDRAYYVWFNHESKLPEMIALTYVEHAATSVKKSHPVTLKKDVDLGDGYYSIKGLSVSSIDAAAGNTEGNSTSSFRIKDNDNNYAFFTPTKEGIYKSGTGTRTYRVKYVVRKSDRTPVSVTTVTSTDSFGNEKIELVETGTTKNVEELPGEYVVYSWYMTIHVFDLEPDGPFVYDSAGGTVILQESLNPGKELTWSLTINSENENSIQYTSDDERSSGILSNDTYRLPLYKHAEHPDMGSCADIVAIAYAGSEPIPDADVKFLDFADTFESKYGVQIEGADGELENIKPDGEAIADGSRGFAKVELNTLRHSRINRTQDHANYAKVTYSPNPSGMGRALGSDEEVFYYKVVVFAEDNLYQYSVYDEIDASDGVVMYSYFTMKPTQSGPGDSGDISGGIDEGGTNSDNASGINLGDKTPKTGDENNLMLWFSLMVLAMLTISIGASKALKK